MLDKDIKAMSFAKRGQELQRIRELIRTHKNKRDHARCWLNDIWLYKRILPEGSSGAGRMDLPMRALISRCKQYIRGQQHILRKK